MSSCDERIGSELPTIGRRHGGAGRLRGHDRCRPCDAADGRDDGDAVACRSSSSASRSTCPTDTLCRQRWSVGQSQWSQGLHPTSWKTILWLARSRGAQRWRLAGPKTRRLREATAAASWAGPLSLPRKRSTRRSRAARPPRESLPARSKAGTPERCFASCARGSSAALPTSSRVAPRRRCRRWASSANR